MKKGGEKDTSGSKNAWTCGFGLALAEIHRLLAGGNNSSGIVEVCRNAGLALSDFKTAGLGDYDLKELRRAGVPYRTSMVLTFEAEKENS